MSPEQEHNWYKQADERVDEIYSDLLDAGTDLPQEVRAIAKALAEVVGHEEVDWAATRPPKIIASGCLYIADTIVRGDDRMTQRELGDTAPVTAAAVREHYHDIPEVFLEHATDSHERRLGPGVMAQLQMFRDAERAGFGLANVDPEEHDPEAVHQLADSISTARQID